MRHPSRDRRAARRFQDDAADAEPPAPPGPVSHQAASILLRWDGCYDVGDRYRRPDPLPQLPSHDGLMFRPHLRSLAQRHDVWHQQSMRLMRLGLAALLCASAAFAVPARSGTTAPAASPADPYGWMDANGQRFTDWVRGQDQITRHELAEQPGYSRLAGEVARLSGHGHGQMGSALTRTGNRLFYERRLSDGGPVDLFSRRLPNGPETLLLDPIRASGLPGASIQTYTPSPDGHFVAVALTVHGSEEAVLRVLSISSGRLLPDSIDRARFAVPEWDPDGTSFYYDRLQNPSSARTAAERFAHQTIYRHVLRTDPELV